MATSIIKIDSVTPPLRWVPVKGEVTETFLLDKSDETRGPTYAELTEGETSVLQEAQRILGRCLPPSEPEGRETGLVIGYVQSGKTLSFETVISLAKDNCYGLVILLAGVRTNLREQSEARLSEDLGIEDGQNWVLLSNPSGQSARATLTQRLAAWRKNPSRKKGLLVSVLKHGSHLQKLTDLLGQLDLRGVPALIIDDESDQASLNTKAAAIANRRASPEERSPIYDRICGLRDVLPHHTYLQYTATPQANLLLARADLLNPSFAEVISPGDGYAGGQAFFGTPKSGLLEPIPPGDIPGPGQSLTAPPKSLLRALRYFLLAAAHHAASPVRKRGAANRSMMVHPALATASHKSYKGIVDKAINAQQRYVEREWSKNPDAVRREFESEYKSLQKTFTDILPLDKLLEVLVDDVFSEHVCVEINGTPDALKKVDWKAHDYWILVGGAKLDRGYTVEGLTVTYMPRSLGTQAAADSLQQRARFFGYKRNYLGLCRVFLPQDTIDAFSEYVRHEEFVRDALIAWRGKPLKEWRRDFLLTQLLKPTRTAVVGLETKRRSTAGWTVPLALHRDPQGIVHNRDVWANAVQKWESEFGVARHLPSRGKTLPSEVIQGVPLRAIIEDLLLLADVKDPSDAEKHGTMLLSLASLLNATDQPLVDVYLVHRGSIDYRTRIPANGLTAKDPRAPIGQYFSNTPGNSDRDLHTASRISLQLRRLDVGHLQRQSDKADIHDVPWLSLYVPDEYAADFVLEA